MSDPIFVGKCAAKSTLVGSNASIMSIQFDDLVSGTLHTYIRAYYWQFKQYPGILFTDVGTLFIYAYANCMFIVREVYPVDNASCKGVKVSLLYVEVYSNKTQYSNKVVTFYMEVYCVISTVFAFSFYCMVHT